MDWVINPYTGRKIKKNGPTYNRLKEEGVNVDSFPPVENKENKENNNESEIELEKFRQWMDIQNNYNPGYISRGLSKAEQVAGKGAGYLQSGAGYLQSGAGYLQSGAGYLQSGAKLAKKANQYF